MALPVLAGIAGKLLSSNKKKDDQSPISGEEKKIKSQKFFDKQKDDGALVKTENKTNNIKPSSALVRTDFPKLENKGLSLNIEAGKSDSSDLSDVSDEVKKIRTGLVKIRGLLAEKKNFDLKSFVDGRKTDQIEKARKKETELERKKYRPKMVGISIPKPEFNFFDFIINYFTNILIGGLLKFLINNKDIISKSFDDITKGFDNIFNVIRYSIISLSTTLPKLTASVAKFSGQLIKGPVKLTGNLLKTLGNSIKTLLTVTGKTLSGFVSNQFKNIRNLAGGAGTRATGVAKRTLPTSTQQTKKPQLRSLPKPGTPKPTSPTTLQSAEKMFKPNGFKHFKKVSGVFKKVPFIGALIGLGIDLAMGERLDNAIAGAAGSSIGAAIGGAIGTAAIPIPFVGTFLGGTIGAAVGDWAGKQIYKNLTGQITQIRPPQESSTVTPQPSPGTVPLSLGYSGSGAPGQLYTSNASVTWYNPGLGGINSGTGRKDPNAPTSTGEPYQATAFTAAAFPPFLSSLPINMTTRSSNNPSGRTLARGQAFHVLVTNKKTKKSAIIRVNDVGSGVGPVSQQTKWLDFSVAARDYLGTGSGFEIRMAPPDARPGPIDLQQVKQIQQMGQSSSANSPTSYTVAGITYDVATGRPIDFPGQRTTAQMGTKTGLVTGYGGGTPFHVDTRWAKDLPMDVVVPMIDSMAAVLAAEGRVIETGTAGTVTGKRYPINGTFEEKKRFLQAATAGHHTQRGMSAFDYFIPKSSETRFGKSAEYANIPAPALPPGYKISFHQGDASSGGSFYQITDSKGKVVFKTFHGDPTKSRLGLLGSANALPQQRSRGLTQRPSYDQSRNTIIFTPPVDSGNQQIIVSNNYNAPHVGGFSQKDLLNSYYKAQLIGFLYKQG